MELRSISKPIQGEFAPYTIMYIDLLPDDGQVLAHMQSNVELMMSMIMPLSDLQRTTPWQEDEWTIHEILSHIIDDERIYTYRALRFARNDSTELLGFDQDDFARYSGANDRTLESIIDEYQAVRAATIALFNNFDDVMLQRVGRFEGKPMSVRAAAYHIAGHELHHINSIGENYLNS